VCETSRGWKRIERACASRGTADKTEAQRAGLLNMHTLIYLRDWRSYSTLSVKVAVPSRQKLMHLEDFAQVLVREAQSSLTWSAWKAGVHSQH
jgi:hypothetical protein